MGVEKDEVQPTAYLGTVKVNIRDKDHYVHTSAPPMGATLDDLEKALLHNRAIIDDCQKRMKEAYVNQVYEFKPPMLVNYDSPTQDAIMAHININILIPLINVRGGKASFAKPETFHVKQRVEIMRNAAERMAHMERHSQHNPMPAALIAMLVVSTVIFALFIN
ncbi:MAG: Unknown protein [uncultured Thiotrichaceae bacterium]|uniref:Uncharacterized protein n=1 Tax=uncultured Thiotrichaceae bacterium TaxID=298394 RepID=A0A6S6S6K1_9GAMM|nr:MAG: Unknown protein [uncultured Thiotrichaceae bacterium]